MPESQKEEAWAEKRERWVDGRMNEGVDRRTDARMVQGGFLKYVTLIAVYLHLQKHMQVKQHIPVTFVWHMYVFMVTLFALDFQTQLSSFTLNQSLVKKCSLFLSNLVVGLQYTTLFYTWQTHRFCSETVYSVKSVQMKMVWMHTLLWTSSHLTYKTKSACSIWKVVPKSLSFRSKPQRFMTLHW